jgi:hypothetical protein
MFVLTEETQKLPAGTLLAEAGNKFMIVAPIDLLGTTVKLKKTVVAKAPPDKAMAATQAMMVHRLKAIADGGKKFKPGALLVIPTKSRGCVVYEVGELTMDHKPRVKIKYRQDLTSDFAPAPKEIGDEAEIEETWAIVVWLSNKAVLDKYDAIDEEMETAAIKSAYEGRLIIAMDDHLGQKDLNKLQMLQDGKAIPNEEDEVIQEFAAEAEQAEYVDDDAPDEDEDEDQDEDQDEGDGDEEDEADPNV